MHHVVVPHADRIRIPHSGGRWPGTALLRMLVEELPVCWSPTRAASSC